ncbi:MAG: glycosyltransferase family 4 protein [Chloroflexi bacterium]|nr:glycosyltransferase family 4 protein [Chloroflexota bacterium]
MAYKIAFVLEQALGHVTHSRNLQQIVSRPEELSPVWLSIPYEVSGVAAKIPVYKSNWTVRSGLRARDLLRKTLQNGPVDGLFFHTQVPAVFCVDWIRKLPSVVSLDATPLQYDQLGDFYHHKPGPDWLEKVKFDRNNAVFLAAKCLVTWTEWAKNSLVKDYGISSDKIVVIPPGVNPKIWSKPADFRKDSRKSVRILFVGGDLVRKGGDLLITAFRSLASDHPDLNLELHLVTKTMVQPGDGIFVYSDLGSNDPRLIDLYHRCDIFALPTSGDCLPMVLSEAGAAGLPVISTTVAAIPEVIREGESGLLVAPGDTRALYGALEKLVSDPKLRTRMGIIGVETINRKFDAVKNTGRLMDLLVETLRSSENSDSKGKTYG